MNDRIIALRHILIIKSIIKLLEFARWQHLVVYNQGHFILAALDQFTSSSIGTKLEPYFRSTQKVTRGQLNHFCRTILRISVACAVVRCPSVCLLSGVVFLTRFS